MKTKSLQSEVLFFLASGQKIDEAVSLYGVQPTSSEVAVIVMSNDAAIASSLGIRGESVDADLFDETSRTDAEKQQRIASIFKINPSVYSDFQSLEKLVLSKIAVKTVL